MVLHSILASSMRGIQRIYQLLAPRAHTAIMMGALFCTLTVKFYHSIRYGITDEYLNWIWADIAVLLGLEVVLSLLCARWPWRWMIRTVTIVAALICAWSVLNAGWIIRTGTQVLPDTLLPLFRDPFNALTIVGVNLLKDPLAALSLMAPSIVALTFFFCVLAHPRPRTQGKIFTRRIIISLVVVLCAIPASGALARNRHRSSSSQATSGLRYNSQLKALATLVFPDRLPFTNADLENTKRHLPYAGQITLPHNHAKPLNLVLVVLEGVQYHYTSLDPNGQASTPFLASLARQGMSFARMRTVLTHTSKALFALQTGRFPSTSQDVVEAVPSRQTFMSLATILKQRGYRTAFFQSAKGNFESRPTLVHNLGFDRFFAREDLHDPNLYLGYLAADEFAMLKPITQWLGAQSGPSFTTILCSVTHDPYEVPAWFEKPAKDPIARYQQVIRYTDTYLKALNDRLTELGLRDNTLFCIVGDHGEAFGEHGKMGHDQIGFEEVLRIPWVLRCPNLTGPRQIHQLTSSIDVTPTLLSLLGVDVAPGHFDGINALAPIPADRTVYFSCWNACGPAGYIQGHTKYLYTPSTQLSAVFDLAADPREQTHLDISDVQAHQIAENVIHWKKQTLLKPNQNVKGKLPIYQHWLCRWAGRDPRSWGTGCR